MKNSVYLIIVLFVTINACSNKVTPFTPNKEFYKKQPNYKSKSEYDFLNYKKLNFDDIFYFTIPNSKNDYYPPNLSNLNSNNYILKDSKYNESNLPKNFKYYLLFPNEMDEFNKNQEDNRFFAAGIKWNKELNEYKNRNKRIINNIIKKKLNSNVIKTLSVCSNLYDTYENIQLQNNSILLKLNVERIAYPRPQNKNIYPSIVLLNLSVFDYKFDTLKIYKQIVFCSKVYSYHSTYQSDFFYNGVTSLLGQFTNDVDFLNSLNFSIDNNTSQIDKNIIEFKKNEEYKRNIVNSLSNNFNLKAYAKVLEESNSKHEFNSELSKISDQAYYSNNSAKDNATYAAVGAGADLVFSILGDISKARDEKHLRENKKTSEKMVENYKKLNIRQLELINYFNENKYLNLSKFNIDIAKDNNMLSAFQNSIEEGQALVKNELEVGQQNSTKALTQSAETIANFNKTNTIQNTTETSAITSTTLSSPNAPECNKISENELKATSEYQSLQRFNIEGGSLGAKEQRVQAKLMELTIKNCRSQLTAKEIQVLEDAIKKAIKNAVKMEDDFKKSNKMKLN